MKRCAFILIIFLAMAAAVSAQTARPRLAVLPFTGTAGNDGETIAMLLGNQNGLQSAFTVVPRTSNVDAIMREQEFQRSGLTDSDTIAQLGRQMNAEYVVAGHVQQLGRSRLVFISIIHVESLQQIAGDYKDYTEISEIRAYLPDMVQKIVAASRQNTSRLPKLAIVPFNRMTSGINERDAEVLTHILSIDIANSGRYAVLPRTSTIQRVFDEHEIQRTGTTDPNTIRRIGIATNAQFVLAGNITSLGNMNLFLAQILNVESGALLIGGDEEYREISDGLSKMQTLARTLTGTSAAAASAAVPAGFVRIQGGTYTRGSPASETGRDADRETPQHQVTVSAFTMSQYLVTQREWFEVMGTTVRQQRDRVSASSEMRGEGDEYPIYYVSWFEAVEYCNRRSTREGLTPAYTITGSGDNRTVAWNRNANGYRLPTEAEWEYACRAGTTTAYSTGSNITTSQANFNNTLNRTSAVGSYAPNAWGLYDMHGNVWEWCWDWYGGYPSRAQNDPDGASSGSDRVLRGGSWSHSAAGVRSAYRSSYTPAYRNSYGGFRVVRP